MSTIQSTTDLTRRSFIDVAAEVLIILVLITAAIYPSPYLERSVFYVGSYWVSGLTLLVPVVVVVGAAYIFIKRSEIHISLADLAVFAFMGYLFVRNGFTSEGSVALKYAVYGLSLYFIVSLVVQKPSSLERLMFAIVCIASVMAAYGFIEYAVQNNFLYQQTVMLTEPKKGVHRIGSSLRHPVAYGAFLLQVIPFIIFSIFIWVRSSKLPQLVLSIIAVIWSFAALVLTFSKGSWIVAMIIAIPSAIFFWRKKDKMGYLFPAAILTLAALVVLFFWRQIYTELYWRSRSSVNARVISWTGALEVIRDNFLFGTGLRQGIRVLWTKTPYQVGFENFYLAITSEGGIIALTLWLSMMGLIIKDGLMTIRKYTGGRYLALAALVSLLAISLNALTFDGMLHWHHFIYFWFAAGILRGASLIHVSEIYPASPS